MSWRERFDGPTRRVLDLGYEESVVLRHGFVGTEHLLLGLLAEGEGRGAMALRELGVTLESVRTRLIEIVGTGDDEVTDPTMILTENAGRVLKKDAAHEAQRAGAGAVDTAHVLAALVRDDDYLAARILSDFGHTREQIRTAARAVG